ncbi:MAG TPA: pentapeptide repeat-containing protein, partial [Acidobacteriaceae bacterium]|nr:pentapeptide repeat-containing protein [Acidobacteriaceae bacterium]
GMRCADLRNAFLVGSQFVLTDLRGANLEGALWNESFGDPAPGLGPNQLARAIIDDTTVLDSSVRNRLKQTQPADAQPPA